MSGALPPADDAAARVEEALAGLPHEWLAPRDGMAAVRVPRARAHEALARLRDRAGYETVTLVTAVDHLSIETGDSGGRPRFEVYWQLLSLRHRDRVRVSAQAEDGEKVPTCVDLWPGAAYMERECYDMFGVRFDGHVGLKRLLMPDEYGHHPLRKDFPHQGIQPDRLYRLWDRERRREAGAEGAR